MRGWVTWARRPRALAPGTVRDRRRDSQRMANNARSDHERQMTREIYDLRHAELALAEETLNRLDSNLALHGIGGEDQITQSLAYLEIFDRLLQQLPADQLRRTFDALGVRIDVHFAPNPDRKPRRQRVPVGGTMIFGAAGIRKGLETKHPRRVPRVMRPTMRIGLVAGAGFEPATSGL